MLIPLFFSFVTLAATCIIEYATLTRRRSISVHVLVRLVAYTLGPAVYFLLHRLGVTQVFFYYGISVIYFVACVYLFTESLPQKIFLFFTDWCFTTLVSELCNWATIGLPDGNAQILVRLLLYMASYALLLPLYAKYGRKYVREMLELFDRANPVYAVFPFLSFVLLTIFFGPLNPAISLSQFITMVLFIGFILFTYYLMISHFHSVFSRLRIENNLMNAERLLVLQKKFYAEVEKGIRAQGERLHDARHHMLALSGLASDGNIDALKQYLSRVLEQYGQSVTARFCENDVANAVIGGYISIAEEKKIAVSAELDLPGKLGIDEYELCTLLGNTLENAIEACERIPAESPLFPNRFIKLKSRVEQDRLIIRVENSCMEDPSASPNGFASSKGASGGIGLESVLAITDLHRGCMSCEKRGSAFIFSAVLCLEPV